MPVINDMVRIEKTIQMEAKFEWEISLLFMDKY